jgi:predicted MFS family arabinose efflux permease
LLVSVLFVGLRLRSRRYGWYVLAVLAVTNFFQYGNRNVVFPMYDDLRAAFDFSNSDLGLLGTVFMLSHALVSLPFGWAGDRYDRRVVISGGMIVWSLAAVASAAADGMGMMLVSRALVGIGTAACVPVATSLLCEVFPPEDKARTVAIFNLGVFLGGGAGFAIGATLGFPGALIVMALPGFLLAVLVWRLDVPANRSDSGGGAGTWRVFVSQARGLLGIRTMRFVLLGAVLMAFAAGGYVAWFFEFLMQVKGYSANRAIVVFGIAMCGGLVGIVSGGVVGDILCRRIVYGRLAAMTIGMLTTVPFAIAVIYLDGDSVPFYVCAIVMMYFIPWYHGPMAAAVDDCATDDRAATAQALAIFVMHIAGTAPSSWVIGEIADRTDLATAMLVPTGAMVLAALAIAAGFGSVGADRVAAER